MFGMGMGEIILIAVVALLVLGPERLPGAAKAIGKGIRDLRAQTKDLQQTIEKDTQIGDAVRELRGALRGDPETLYKKATGEDFRDKPGDDDKGVPPTESAGAPDDASTPAGASPSDQSPTPSPPPIPTPPPTPPPTPGTDEASASKASVIDEAFANTDDSWGEPASNPHEDSPADADLPVIRTPAGAMPRGADDDSNDDQSHG